MVEGLARFVHKSVYAPTALGLKANFYRARQPMISSSQLVQSTMTQLTGLCARLAQECHVSAASILFSGEGQRVLGGRVAAGFPTPDQACRLRPVATAAVVGENGRIWGLLLLSKDHPAPLSSTALIRLSDTAAVVAVRMDHISVRVLPAAA